MELSEFSPGDFIVIDNNNHITTGEICSVDDFFIRAEEGLTIDGDLYCRISDFSFENYQIIKEAVKDTKWFDFSKEDIPSWFKADEAIIVNVPDNIKLNTDIDDNEIAKRSIEDQEQLEKEILRQKIKEKNIQNDNTMIENRDNNFDDSEEDYSSTIEGVKSLFESSKEEIQEPGNKEATIYVFGSSKGGTGKTFTCLISGYRYAKIHPGKKVAIVDFDIIDGQIGISIHKVQPTMISYWRTWLNGDKSFTAMRNVATKSEHFPNNVDFYLAPKDHYINDKEFWIDVISNLTANYDTVFFDTGIDYINYPPIAFVYKIADRVVLVSTTSIKSVSSVLKQISKLKGQSSSADASGTEIFSKEDNIGPKLRLAITGCDSNDSMNNIVIETFNKNIKINAIFGQLSSTIGKAEYYGQWDIFDKNKKFNEALDRLLDLEQ